MSLALIVSMLSKFTSDRKQLVSSYLRAVGEVGGDTHVKLVILVKPFLSLDEALASRAAFVIVSQSD